MSICNVAVATEEGINENNTSTEDILIKDTTCEEQMN